MKSHLLPYHLVNHTVFLHDAGGMALVEQLKKDPALSGQSEAAVALDAMQLLLHYCSILGITDKVSERLCI